VVPIRKGGVRLECVKEEIRPWPSSPKKKTKKTMKLSAQGGNKGGKPFSSLTKSSYSLSKGKLFPQDVDWTAAVLERKKQPAVSRGGEKKR